MMLIVAGLVAGMLMQVKASSDQITLAEAKAAGNVIYYVNCATNEVLPKGKTSECWFANDGTVAVPAPGYVATPFFGGVADRRIIGAEDKSTPIIIEGGSYGGMPITVPKGSYVVVITPPSSQSKIKVAPAPEPKLHDWNGQQWQDHGMPNCLNPDFKNGGNQPCVTYGPGQEQGGFIDHGYSTCVYLTGKSDPCIPMGVGGAPPPPPPQIPTATIMVTADKAKSLLTVAVACPAGYIVKMPLLKETPSDKNVAESLEAMFGSTCSNSGGVRAGEVTPTITYTLDLWKTAREWSNQHWIDMNLSGSGKPKQKEK